MNRPNPNTDIRWFVFLAAIALSNGAIADPLRYDTIRYDTIEEINVDSKAEYTA